jgi:beta-phosphoglucomutase-like phosphatase (HAD superfamily)
MSVKGLVVGVDLDGVCADFYRRMREITAEWLECKIADLPESVSYGLAEWGVKPDRYESLHRFAVLQRSLFETSPMISGARKYLRRLSDEGARIRIITHRLFVFYFHKAAVSQTVGWLDHHGIPYVDLCFMKEKDQVGADVYVEDSPANVESLRGRGHQVICFGNSTNTLVPPPRATSWEEAYNLIHEYAVRERKPGP